MSPRLDNAIDLNLSLVQKRSERRGNLNGATAYDANRGHPKPVIQTSEPPRHHRNHKLIFF
jgi:hypothetical protein